jgi:phosphoserine phosphatase
MARPHLFDLDGMLLHGTSVPVEISRQLGLEAEMVALDGEIGTQRIRSPEYARRVNALLGAAAKVKIADRLCEKFGVSRAACMVCGDSFSDVELFGAVPVSVAINVDQHVAGLATHWYAGRYLWEACELVRHAR